MSGINEDEVARIRTPRVFIEGREYRTRLERNTYTKRRLRSYCKGPERAPFTTVHAFVFETKPIGLMPENGCRTEWRHVHLSHVSYLTLSRLRWSVPFCSTTTPIRPQRSPYHSTMPKPVGLREQYPSQYLLVSPPWAIHKSSGSTCS